MSIALVRLILYVHDVGAVKAFYQTHVALSVTKEIADSQPAASSWRCTGWGKPNDSSRRHVHPAA
ncbi:lactoylglutathione lyase [Xanthomonas oryzae]|nr:lactoylglutathione lyase [Xanthomonas oryzae]